MKKKAAPKGKPKSVLFVCLGNIIRSPLCEGLLKYKTQDLIIDSAACTHDDIGQHPHKHAQKVAKEHGFDISAHVSRYITNEDFNTYDLIVSLEKFVQSRLTSMQPAGSKADVVRFAKYDIRNPWASPYRDFVTMYAQIEESMASFIEQYIDPSHLK